MFFCLWVAPPAGADTLFLITLVDCPAKGKYRCTFFVEPGDLNPMHDLPWMGGHRGSVSSWLSDSDAGSLGTPGTYPCC